MYGPDGVHFYTRTKVVTSRWPSTSPRAIDLGFPQNR
jgi:malonate-semialdehyde dehydrogenase (acetylating)/methylmalonate-semialdehyde dehydrogenase